MTFDASVTATEVSVSDGVRMVVALGIDGAMSWSVL